MANKKNVVILGLSCWIILLFSLSANAYDFPPYEGLKLKIAGTISEYYSNNANFAYDKNDTEEEFRTMLALNLDLKYEGKRRSLGLSGIANRRIEYDDSDRSNSSERMVLFFNNDFSEYDKIRISNTFSHTQEPDSFRRNPNINDCRNDFENYGYSPEQIEAECNKFEEEFGRIRGRFDSYSNRLNFDYSKSISEYFQIFTKYIYGKNWSKEDGTKDSDLNNVGMTLNYMYSQATNFSVSYNYVISEYEEGDDITVQKAKAGLKQYLTRRLFFDGSIGRDFVSSGEDNISINAGLTGEIDEKTTGRLLFSQGTEISPDKEDTFRSWRVTSIFTSSLLEDLSSSISAFYGEGEFVSEDITNKLLGASFNLAYNFWRGKRGSSFSGNLGYSYSDVDSTEENSGYTRSSVTSSLNLIF